MWNMQKITVDDVRVDSYAYSGYHLHRCTNLSGSWQISKKNWLGQFENKGFDLSWAEAREQFDDFTRVYITNSW
jgi:hypothetical protein